MENKNIKPILIIMSVILLCCCLTMLLAIAGCILVSQPTIPANDTTQNLTISITPTPSVTVPTVTPTNNQATTQPDYLTADYKISNIIKLDTSFWKTHTVNELGFKFKYPDSKKVSVTTNEFLCTSIEFFEGFSLTLGHKRELEGLLLNPCYPSGFGIVCATDKFTYIGTQVSILGEKYILREPYYECNFEDKHSSFLYEIATFNINVFQTDTDSIGFGVSPIEVGGHDFSQYDGYDKYKLIKNQIHNILESIELL